MTPEENSIIDNLILSGALEPCGIDMESGEMLYNFTEKLKQIDPLLHDEFQRYFTSETMALWEHGFIEMDLTLDQPVVSLTQKAFDSVEVLTLDKDHQYTLKEIIRIILDDSEK